MNVHSWAVARPAPINIVMPINTSCTVRLEGARIWKFYTGPTDMGKIPEDIVTADARRKSRLAWHQIKVVSPLKHSESGNVLIRWHWDRFGKLNRQMVVIDTTY